MKRIGMFLAVLAVSALFMTGAGGKPEVLKMATTTSVENSKLLDRILPVFEKKFNVKVNVIAVGSGKALEIAKNGDVDMVFVHSPKDEDKFVKDGYGVKRIMVMSNYFNIVGPEKDPAGIKGMTDSAKAFAKIAGSKSVFISRGDDSGTNKKELDIWKKAGVKPEGEWYLNVGKGMEGALTMTSDKAGYTLTDRATFLFMKDKLALKALVVKDENLYNLYSVIAVNTAKNPNVNNKLANTFINWITSKDAQKLIGEYKIGGEQMFTPLAGKEAKKK